MHTFGVFALLFAAGLSALAALAHVACVVIGAPAYRLMGAGERMARAAEQTKRKPALITGVIAIALAIWSAYALSGAGVIGPLPMTKTALVTIGIVLLGRAVAFPLLRPVFRENSMTFWLVSSGVCLVMGLSFLLGAFAVWQML